MSYRIFECFPQNDSTRCPICGTGEDKPCFLMPIDGTEHDGICEATPTHVDCIRETLERWRYNREFNVVYQRGEEVSR